MTALPFGAQATPHPRAPTRGHQGSSRDAVFLPVVTGAVTRVRSGVRRTSRRSASTVADRACAPSVPLRLAKAPAPSQFRNWLSLSGASPDVRSLDAAALRVFLRADKCRITPENHNHSSGGTPLGATGPARGSHLGRHTGPGQCGPYLPATDIPGHRRLLCAACF